MSKETFKIVQIGMVILVGLGVFWQFYTVNNLGAFQTTELVPIDYTPLESAVELWKEKKEFSMAGAQRAAESSEIETEQTDNEPENDVITVSILNGSTDSRDISIIESQLLAIEGIAVENTGSTDLTDTTTIAYTVTLDSALVNQMVGILEPIYTDVTRTILTGNEEYDVIITIGNTPSVPSESNP